MKIRAVRRADATALTTLLNEIIARGGTTAWEDPFTPDGLADAMLIGADVICCFVAEAECGELLGFQSLVRSDALPPEVGDIATFSRVGSVRTGTGSRLFAATRKIAEESHLAAINATIRADNEGGLHFYRRLGFEDHSIRRAVALKAGTQVDRVIKRYCLALTPTQRSRGIS